MTCLASISRADAPNSSDFRFGWLNQLDSRTMYAADFFPEPLLAEEGDSDQELRTTWLHAEGSGASQDLLSAEVEDNIGLTTFEIDGGWERDTFYDADDDDSTDPDTVQGMDSVELTVRHPFLQWISADGTIDDTVVAGFSLSIPVNTAVSEDFEIEPQAWNMLRLGDHWTVQTRVAYSNLVGGGDEGNQDTLEYAATLGYRVDLGNAIVRQLTPLAELDGEDPLNHSAAGDDQLQGVVGAELGFRGSEDIQPSLSVGYTFPIDAGARREFQWGIVTSLMIDF
ncbi:MAG: hypothetical protein ABSF29_16070 [Tepidisphaeraceae bacterium]|jgi:hypothetical protein